MSDTVTLLTKPMNFAVVQLPERKYPGVVVQGDTLYSFVQRLSLMKDLLKTGSVDSLAIEIDDFEQVLCEVLTFYRKICADNSIGSPFNG